MNVFREVVSLTDFFIKVCEVSHNFSWHLKLYTFREQPVAYACATLHKKSDFKFGYSP